MQDRLATDWQKQEKVNDDFDTRIDELKPQSKKEPAQDSNLEKEFKQLKEQTKEDREYARTKVDHVAQENEELNKQMLEVRQAVDRKLDDMDN